jgi:hypothetical protein
MPKHQNTTAEFFRTHTRHGEDETHYLTITDKPQTLLLENKKKAFDERDRVWKKKDGYCVMRVNLNGKSRKVAGNFKDDSRRAYNFIKKDAGGEGYHGIYYEVHPDDKVYYVGRPFCDHEGKQWVVREKWVNWGGVIPMRLDSGLMCRLDILDRFITRPKKNCGMLITEFKASAVYNPFDGPADPVLAEVREKRIALNEAIAAEAMKPARVASRFERYGDDWDLYA